MAAIADLSVNISANTASLDKATKAINRLNGQFLSSSKRIEKAVGRMEKAFNRLNGQMLSSSQRVAKSNQQAAKAFDGLSKKSKKAQDDVGKTTQKQNSFSQSTEKGASGLTRFTDELDGVARSVRVLEGPLGGTAARMQTLVAIFKSGRLALIAFVGAATAGVAALGLMAKAAVNTALEMERIEKRIKFATNSTAQAEQTFQFLVDRARELGLDLQTTAQQFSSLAAAARGTALQGEATTEIFKGITAAGRAMGLTTDQMAGALRAIQQMISKGNVQAEELRGQLGERLPGAFRLAAEALGVTTSELNKMLEQGEVMATDLLPKLADVLQRTFGKAAEDASDTLGANIQKLQTEITLFLDKFGEVTKVVELVNATIKALTGTIKSLTENFEGLIRNVITILGLLAGAFSGKIITGLAKAFFGLGRAILTTTGVTTALSGVLAGNAIALLPSLRKIFSVLRTGIPLLVKFNTVIAIMNGLLMLNPIAAVAAILAKLAVAIGIATGVMSLFNRSLEDNEGDSKRAKTASEELTEAQENVAKAIAQGNVELAKRASIQKSQVIAGVEAELEEVRRRERELRTAVQEAAGGVSRGQIEVGTAVLSPGLTESQRQLQNLQKELKANQKESDKLEQELRELNEQARVPIKSDLPNVGEEAEEVAQEIAELTKEFANAQETLNAVSQAGTAEAAEEAIRFTQAQQKAREIVSESDLAIGDLANKTSQLASQLANAENATQEEKEAFNRLFFALAGTENKYEDVIRAIAQFIVDTDKAKQKTEELKAALENTALADFFSAAEKDINVLEQRVKGNEAIAEQMELQRKIQEQINELEEQANRDLTKKEKGRVENTIKRKEELKQQLEIQKELENREDNIDILRAKIQGNEQLVERLQTQQEIQDTIRSIERASLSQLSAEEKQRIANNILIEKALERQLDQIEKQKETAKELREIFTDLATRLLEEILPEGTGPIFRTAQRVREAGGTPEQVRRAARFEEAIQIAGGSERAVTPGERIEQINKGLESLDERGGTGFRNRIGIIEAQNGFSGAFRGGGPPDSKLFMARVSPGEPIRIGQEFTAPMTTASGVVQNSGTTVIQIDARGASAGVERRITERVNQALALSKSNANQFKSLARSRFG